MTKASPETPWGEFGGNGRAVGHQFKDEVGYYGAHYRVKVKRGPASAQVCPCGEPAKDWCFMGDIGSAQYGDIKQSKDVVQFGIWSSDVEDYEALCRTCHRRLDVMERNTLAYSLLKARFHAEELGHEIAEPIRTLLARLFPEN